MSTFDTWKSKIPGCFGSADGKFAVHVLDLERAAELLYECVKCRITLGELTEEAKIYLELKFDPKVEDKNALNTHIDAEMQRMSSMFREWLDP